MSLEPEIYPNRTTDVYSAVRNCCTPLKYGFFCAWLYGTQNYLINFCGHLTCNEFYADQRKNVWNTGPPGFIWPNVVKFGISEVRLIVPNLRPLAHIDLDTPRHATGLYLRWHLSHLHTNSFVRCVLWQAVSQWRHTCTCRSKTQCWRKHFDLRGHICGPQFTISARSADIRLVTTAVKLFSILLRKRKLLCTCPGRYLMFWKRFCQGFWSSVMWHYR